jgi:transcriptional regulator with XRE-family HTH domain
MKQKRSLLIQLGQNIRAARHLSGLSQEALALEAGLDRTYVGGVERGERNVSILNLHRISVVLGLSLSDLLQNVQDESSGQEYP